MIGHVSDEGRQLQAGAVTCERASAPNSISHGLPGGDNRNPGRRTIIDFDAYLRGTFSDVIICHEDIRVRALISHLRDLRALDGARCTPA